MEKKKKRLIILSVIAGVLCFVILLTSAIFTIKSTSIEYQTTLTVLTTDDLSAMVESVDIPYGKSIFFSSLRDCRANMEKLCPYVKINGIERTFPNSLVVLVSERVPVVRVETPNGTYVLDSDLKVLNLAKTLGDYNSASSELDLPVLVVSDDFGLDVVSAEEGEFVSNKKIAEYVDAFYRGAVTTSPEDASVAVSMISSIASIQIGYKEELKKTIFNLTYKGTGLTTEIIGDNNLVDNVYKVINTVNQLLSSGVEYESVNCTDGKIYIVDKKV